MHYFAVFTFDSNEMAVGELPDIRAELEDIGLKNAVIPKDGALMTLPATTFIGEYEYADKEELKNILYTEVSRIFEENGMGGTIFIAVCEKASIGVDILVYDSIKS